MKTLKDRIHAAIAYRKSIAQQGEDISQANIARFCKVSTPSVNDWLSGKTKTMKAATALKAAEYLKVRADWLANNIGPMVDDGAMGAPLLTMNPSAWAPPLQASGFDAKNIGPSGIYSLEGISAMIRDAVKLPEEFLVRLTDGALAPRQSAGDLVRLSSRKADVEQVAAGDGVLISTGNGFVMLRLYKTKGDGTWSAESENTNFLPLQSVADELTVLAVVVGAETTGRWASKPI